jgi:hypothetical protein
MAAESPLGTCAAAGEAEAGAARARDDSATAGSTAVVAATRGKEGLAAVELGVPDVLIGRPPGTADSVSLLVKGDTRDDDVASVNFFY